MGPVLLRSLPRPAAASYFSTQVEKQLADFLKSEIEAEKDLARKQLPNGASPKMEGFQVSTNDAEITLSKAHGSETVRVKFNVNHTVDPVPNIETEGQQEESAPSSPMVSRPDFKVEVVKNSQMLVFQCFFVGPDDEGLEAGAQESDLFNIQEVYVCQADGSSTDNVYSVSGEIMDGSLYDHLMNYLAERGIDDRFADQLVKFATHYEHAQYVALLQKIQDFVGK
jgi:complement component 1 Q subcomponent-binding protein